LKEIKDIVSLRLTNSDRAAVQHIASRLFARESDIYRLAIGHLLNRFGFLADSSCTGSDLLLIMVEVREEINHAIGLNRYQLEKIINGRLLHPDRYVHMMDIELLLMPQHFLAQQLTKLCCKPKNNLSIEGWLKDYLTHKYKNPRRY
jgi:hypothetical protein